MTLLELADAVERAQGPDRELDTDIWIALGGRAITWVPERPFQLPASVVTRIVNGREIEYRAAPFTGSLDAAMSLVPNGMDWFRRSRFGMSVQPPAEGNGERPKLRFSSFGRSPAVALTAAALRAIAHLDASATN